MPRMLRLALYAFVLMTLGTLHAPFYSHAQPPPTSTQEERITLRFHGPDIPIPELTVLDGAHPRIIVDAMRVASWNGPQDKPLGGRYLTHLSSAYRKTTGHVQVVILLSDAPAAFIISSSYEIQGGALLFTVTVTPRPAKKRHIPS